MCLVAGLSKVWEEVWRRGRCGDWEEWEKEEEGEGEGEGTSWVRGILENSIKGSIS